MSLFAPHLYIPCNYPQCCGGNKCETCHNVREDSVHAADPVNNYDEAAALREQRTKDSNPKDAIGITKPPMSTVPATIEFLLGLAWMEGGLKYGRHNYRVVGVRASVYYDAARRHLAKWWEGEDTDPDSGLPHLVKAMASLGVVLDAEIADKLTDDRPPKINPEFWAKVQKLADDLRKKYPNAVKPYTELNKNETR